MRVLTRWARASYDEDVAIYRNTGIKAFQSIEESLSSMRHLGAQALAKARILSGNEMLCASTPGQWQVNSIGKEALLTNQLTPLQARQYLVDTRSVLSQSNIMLIKNCDGCWQWNAAAGYSAPAADVTQPRSRS